MGSKTHPIHYNVTRGTLEFLRRGFCGFHVDRRWTIMDMIKLILLCVVGLHHCAYVIGVSTSDPRWLRRPVTRVQRVVEGSELLLSWRYELPAQTQKAGRMIFSHHYPGNSYEDVLLRGAIDPVSGDVSLVDVLYPDRLSLVTDAGVIQVSLLIGSSADTGEYMMSLYFPGEQPIEDVIETLVYQKPKWLRVPEAETLASLNSHVTFTWKPHALSREPRMRSVLIKHVDVFNHATSVADAQMTDSWTMSYSPKSKHDTILDIHPDGSVINLSLWDLCEGDAGSYQIRVIYEHDIFVLEHELQLFMDTGLGWITTPPPNVYTLESRDLSLNYLPNIRHYNVTNVVRLTLTKMASYKTEIISVSYDTKPHLHKSDVTKRSTREESQPLVLFDNDHSRITFMLTNIQRNDSGTYQVRMYIENHLSQQHNVNITVLSEHDVQPLFTLDGVPLEGNRSYQVTPGQLVIITPAGVPLPQMELYSLAGGTTSLYVKGFNVSFLEVMMTDEMLKDDGITLGVYYGFYHETYDFMLATSNSTGAFASSANVIGVIVLIPLIIICIVLVVLLALRQRRKTRTKKYSKIPPKPAVEMRTIRGRIPTVDDSSVKDSAVHDMSSAPRHSSSQAGTSLSSDHDEGYQSNSVPRYRDSRHGNGSAHCRDHKQTPRRTGAKLSLVIEHEKKTIEPDVRCLDSVDDCAFRGRDSSYTSDGSTPGRRSKSTFVVRSIYVKKDSVDSDRSFSSSSPVTRSSFRSSPNLPTSPVPINQHAPQYFQFPTGPEAHDSHPTRRPQSNLENMYSKSHGDRLGGNDTLYPGMCSLRAKPKSTSTLPNLSTNRLEVPSYKIRPATGTNVYSNTLPAFLVKYRLRENELDTSTHNIANNKPPKTVENNTRLPDKQPLEQTT